MATPAQRSALLAITCPWCQASPGEVCSMPARVVELDATPRVAYDAGTGSRSPAWTRGVTTPGGRPLGWGQRRYWRRWWRRGVQRPCRGSRSPLWRPLRAQQRPRQRIGHGDGRGGRAVRCVPAVPRSAGSGVYDAAGLGDHAPPAACSLAGRRARRARGAVDPAGPGHRVGRWSGPAVRAAPPVARGVAYRGCAAGRTGRSVRTRRRRWRSGRRGPGRTGRTTGRPWMARGRCRPARRRSGRARRHRAGRWCTGRPRTR